MKRIASLDKLDKINYYSKMHTHLVKWWDVNITDPTKIPVDGEAFEDDKDSSDMESSDAAYAAADDYDADAVADKLLADALSEDFDASAVEGSVTDGESSGAEEMISTGDPEVDATAMEIYNRLMREAAADEAAKQAEIEAAKKAAEEN